MVRRSSALLRCKDDFFVVGSVADPLGRRRIETAVRDHGSVQWEPDFTSLAAQLTGGVRRVSVIVLDMEDRNRAAAAAFAETISENSPGVGIVVYRKPVLGSEAEAMLLGAAGVHDTIVAGLTDDAYSARTILLGSRRAGAADVVLKRLRGILPKKLHLYVQTAVRNPGRSTITAVTEHLNIHRQTPNVWCRREHIIRAEELLIWSRLLLAGALLDLTSRTLESISIELEYASPTALRNQLKSYTGLTATQIRASGFESLIGFFEGRLAQHRAGLSGASSRARLHEPNSAILPLPVLGRAER